MADGLGKDVGDRDVVNFVALHPRLGGDGVQKDHMVQHAVGDALDGGAGEDPVGGAGGDAAGVAYLNEGLRRVLQRAE